MKEGEAEIDIVEQPGLFIFGLGYCGSRLANVLAAQDWSVAGSVRSMAEKEVLLDSRVQVYILPQQQEVCLLYTIIHCIDYLI